MLGTLLIGFVRSLDRIEGLERYEGISYTFVQLCAASLSDLIA
jgi:hypothetical protein